MSKNEPFAPWQCPLCGEKLTDKVGVCTVVRGPDRADSERIGKALAVFAQRDGQRDIRVRRRGEGDLLPDPLDILTAEQIGILPLGEIKRDTAVGFIGVPVGEDGLVDPVVIDKLDASALLGEKFRLRLFLFML